MLEIVTNPSQILRKKAKSINLKDISSKEIKTLIDQMAKTMLESDGPGLAAPQIGKSIRLIIVNIKQGPIALINPKIIRKSWRKCIDEEGCLSIPKVYGNVKRSHSIKVKTYNQHGKLIKLKAKGLFARVIQHEVDHLNGILFIDKVQKVKNLKDQVL